MIKQIGRFQINKRFLLLLDTTTKKLLKDKIWSKVRIITTDIDPNLTFHFIAESEFFAPINIGRNTIPDYEIVIYSDKFGHLIDFKFNIIN